MCPGHRAIAGCCLRIDACCAQPPSKKSTSIADCCPCAGAWHAQGSPESNIVLVLDLEPLQGCQGQDSERKLERSLLLVRASLDTMCLRAREISSKVGRSLGSLAMHCLPSLQCIIGLELGHSQGLYISLAHLRHHVLQRLGDVFQCGALLGVPRHALPAPPARHHAASFGCFSVALQQASAETLRYTPFRRWHLQPILSFFSAGMAVGLYRE